MVDENCELDPRNEFLLKDPGIRTLIEEAQEHAHRFSLMDTDKLVHWFNQYQTSEINPNMFIEMLVALHDFGPILNQPKTTWTDIYKAAGYI